MVQTIKIPSKEMELINDLLNLTGDEIYQKYGYKRDETITHTAKFPNGIEFVKKKLHIQKVYYSIMDLN